MTIAQALRRIAKLKGEYKELLDRAAGAVTFPTKQPPAFVFGEVMEQARAKCAEMIGLEAALRVTNAVTEVNGKMTVTEATIRLQEYKAEIAWLRSLQVRAHDKTVEQSVEFDNTAMKSVRVDCEFTCALPEARRAVLISTVQAQFDELNDLVEGVNHRTTLVTK